MATRQYLPRIVDGDLSGLVGEVGAVAVDGPKAVGKTETARRVCNDEVLLDDPRLRTVAAADPPALLSGTPPILVDEWQLVPPIWDTVRRAVDADTSPGQFVLTGSARPAEATAHTGAGRIVHLRMRPLTLVERDERDGLVSLGTLLDGGRPDVTGRGVRDLRGYVDAIVASGFPGLQGLSVTAREALLDGYVESTIQRDVEEAGHEVRRPETLRRWLRAYAAAVGTTTSIERIRDAATAGDGTTPAKGTVLTYHEMLQRLWVVDDVPGWSPSQRRLTTVTQAPKRHLADPALAVTLLGLDADGVLRDGPLLGQLFESLATLCVRVFAQAARARVHHLRTHGGKHEVDLIVERRDGRVLAIEVKLSGSVQGKDVAQLQWLQDRLGDSMVDAVVLTTGTHAYRRQDGIAVVPLELLGP